MLSISRLLLLASIVVSLMLFGGTYLLLSGFGDRMLQQSTVQNLQSLGKVTFTSMYQIMNQGWSRDQVQSFGDSVAKSVVGMPMQIDFHRGAGVSQQYGSARADQGDDAVALVMKTGRDKEISTAEGMRFLYAMKAGSDCLACHTNAKKGEVLGVIDIQAGYGKSIKETRTHLLLVLLLLAPLPMVAGFILTVVLDLRMNDFLHQLDSAIERTPTGEKPDFSAVVTRFSEFRELLGHFKRLIKG